MAIEIKMPQLSDTMDSGKILTWNKQEGDVVERGDILAEVETDKANLEIESFHHGTLLKIITSAEQTAQVGEVIAVIGEEGEEIEQTGTKAESGNSTTQESESKDETASTQEDSTTAELISTKSSSNGSTQSPQSEPQQEQASNRVKASPLAKKIASQKNIDLKNVTGSGPDGRIVKRDLEAMREESGSSKTPVRESNTPQNTRQPSTPDNGAQPRGSDDGTLTPLNKMRQTIARRMQQSVVESPHFYVSTSILMDQVVKLRAVLKEREGYAGLSYNHFVIAALGYAVRAEPGVNCAYREPQQILQPASVNVGVITSVEGGLIIPVLHRVEEMSLQDIVLEAKAVLDRVRAGRPQSKDLTGGTISISNLGMFDVENFTALINPGQGAVLAVGGILDQPHVIDGQIIPAKIMKVTLSVDHRVIDGVIGANFLKHFKEALECPALLLAP